MCVCVCVCVATAGEPADVNVEEDDTKRHKGKVLGIMTRTVSMVETGLEVPGTVFGWWSLCGLGAPPLEL